MRLLLHVIILLPFIAAGQPVERPHFSMQAGFGAFHYINTLQIGSSLVDGRNTGFCFRVMREFEHRLALGVESGYYQFYKVSKSSTSSSPLGGEAILSVIPILLNIRMRVLPNFYLAGGTGVSILASEFGGPAGRTASSQISLADFQLSALYMKVFRDHFEVGGELKLINVAKTEDHGFALMLMVGYRF